MAKEYASEGEEKGKRLLRTVSPQGPRPLRNLQPCVAPVCSGAGSKMGVNHASAHGHLVALRETERQDACTQRVTTR